MLTILCSSQISAKIFLKEALQIQSSSRDLSEKPDSVLWFGILSFHFLIKGPLQFSITYQACSNMAEWQEHNLSTAGLNSNLNSTCSTSEQSPVTLLSIGVTVALKIVLRIQRGNRGVLDERKFTFFCCPVFTIRISSEPILPSLYYSMKSKQCLHHYLVTLRPLFKQITLPGKSSIHVYHSSRPKKLFLGDCHRHSSKCFTGIPSAL